MYQSAVLRSLYVKTFANRIISTPAPRSYSSKLVKNDADLDAVREWFSKFNRNTIPESISTTTYSHSSGAGGQKVNKTSSKANTTWPLNLLQHHVPKALMVALRGSRRYVVSSDSIQIQCDSHRSRTDNKTETHRRLWEEIKILYEKNVPGITSPEKKAQIAAIRRNYPMKAQACRNGKKESSNLYRKILKAKKEKMKGKSLAEKQEEAKRRKAEQAKADNDRRLELKKKHSDKKKARGGPSRFD